MTHKVFNSRYQIGAMIGTGGMADVYVAEDLRLHRKVAVKILRSDLARDPAFIARFKKEALAAGALNNPRIVAVFDSGEDGAESYIVMELVSGHTLRQVLQTGREIPESESIAIVMEILEALEYSHEQGIIHRDIKPGNIMITDSGKVKVMDFGIARALDDIGATMTNTWNVVGTAQYLSPEQATGEYSDPRSDIYSVGCLMYELLVGRPPFVGDTPVSIAFQHVSAPLTPPSDINPDIDPNLETIIKVALQKDPNNRYQNAGAMLADLRRAVRGEQVTTKIKRVKPRRWLFLAAGVIIALGLIAGATLFTKSHTPSTTSLEVPNVVGLTDAQARALLPNFTINIQLGPSSTIPKGRVSSQLPLAASKVISGSSITLTESSGPGNTSVPINLVGLSLADARNALSAAGLTVALTTSTDSNQAPGTVLGVDPSPGSILAAGTGVTLQIASGSLQVPNLVGLTDVQAITTLTQAGFLVRTATAYDSTQNDQVVLAQAPDAGTSESIGSAVTITVNTPPVADPSPSN
jgi:serine/threonine-protein kinase